MDMFGQRNAGQILDTVQRTLNGPSVPISDDPHRTLVLQWSRVSFENVPFRIFKPRCFVLKTANSQISERNRRARAVVAMCSIQYPGTQTLQFQYFVFRSAHTAGVGAAVAFLLPLNPDLIAVVQHENLRLLCTATGRSAWQPGASRNRTVGLDRRDR